MPTIGETFEAKHELVVDIELPRIQADEVFKFGDYKRFDTKV